MLATDLRLALRNVVRQKRRSLIAMAAIGFGVIAMILSVGYIEWIFWANRELSTVSQIGHIQVAAPGYHEEGLSDPFRFLVASKSEAIQNLKRQAQVQSLAPRLTFNGLISHGENTLSFIGEGIDPDNDPSYRNLLVIQGELPSNQDPNGIVLGAGLAASLGVKTGDSIVLLTNTASGGINAIEGHVRGLISTSMKAFDDNILRIPFATAQGLLRTQGVHLWVVSLKHTALTDRVVQRLKTDPAFKDLQVVPWTELADFYNKTVALFSRQMGVVKLIIAIIIVLSISNTMTMSVMERTVEIGTAMALGLRRRRILRLFLLEGGVLGVMGGAGGLVLGYLAAQVISAIGIPMPPAPGMSRGFVAGIIVTPGSMLEALALAILTTLLASIYPAWNASRLVIVDALRHNR